MSNKFNVIECCLCNFAIGFNFTDAKIENQYCYKCGHSILLIKDKLSDKKIDFDKIKDYKPEEYSKGKEYETAVVYFLNKLQKTLDKPE